MDKKVHLVDGLVKRLLSQRRTSYSAPEEQRCVASLHHDEQPEEKVLESYLLELYRTKNIIPKRP